MANDLNIDWKDGVGEVTDQPLIVSPGSGTGNAPVSFGSVINKGLDRTLDLEVTTLNGEKRTLTVNQEGCRQAYVTSDGKRWLTSDNQVYGVLKGDAPCECTDGCGQPTNYFVLYDLADGGASGLNSTFSVRQPYEGYAHNGIEEFIYEFGWHVEGNDDGYNIPGVGGESNPMMPGIASGMVIRGQSGGWYAVNDGFTLFLDHSSGSVKLFVGVFSYDGNEYQPVSVGLPGNDGNIKISFKKTSNMSGTIKIYVNDAEKSVLFMPYSGDGYEDLAGLTGNQVTILGTEKRHFTSFRHAIRTYEEHMPIN